LDNTVSSETTTETQLPFELHSSLGVLWGIRNNFKDSGRTYPITKGEIGSLLHPKNIKKLVKLGYILEEILPAIDPLTKKNIGSRSCILITELGISYCDKHLNSQEIV
jgi:hypothetical protein